MSDTTPAATPAPTPTATPGQVDTDRIVHAVAQARTIRDSVFALLHHIAGEIRAAWEDNTPAAKDAVLEFLDASKARIADAVTDNTDQNIFPNRAPGQGQGQQTGDGQTSSVSRDRDPNLPDHLHQPPGGVIIAGVSQMPSASAVPVPAPAIDPEAPIRAPGDPLPNAGVIEQTPHPDAVRAAIEANERAVSGEPVPDATVATAPGTATETRNEDDPTLPAASAPAPVSRDENEVFGDTNPPAAPPVSPASPGPASVPPTTSRTP